MEGLHEDAAVTPNGPLAGVRVVEIGSGIAGPLAAMWLGDMGADVAKVEWGQGDWTRRTAEPGDQSLFKSLNRNKISLHMPELSLTPALQQLIREAHAVIVDEDVDRDLSLVTRIKEWALPVVCCRVSGFSQTGSFAGKKTVSELTLQAATWPWRFIGEPGGPPSRAGADVAGSWTAIALSQAVLLGILQARRTRAPAIVEVSHLGALASVYGWRWFWESDPTEEHWFMHSDTEPGELQRSYPVYETADGYLMFDLYEFGITPSETKWANLIRAVGLGHLLEDERFASFTGRRRNFPEWIAVFGEATRARKTEDLARLVEELGGFSVPVNDIPSILAHEQSLEMGYSQKPDFPGYRGALGPLWEFSATPASIRKPPPLQWTEIEHYVVESEQA